VALVLVLAAGALVVIKEKVFTPSRRVPVLVPLTLTAAKAAAAHDHFTLRLDHGVTSITVPAGSVVSQSPKVGTSLKEGSVLSVVPSLGPPPVPVPSLAKTTCATAATALTAAHLTSTCAAPQYSSTVPSGVLISWALGKKPNPTSAPYGSTITLVPSKGHAPVAVPTIPAGDTYAQAQTVLQAAGFVAAQATAISDSVTAGQFISSSPAVGTSAPYGSTVTVTVSSGPPVVPNVVGDTVAEAEAALQQQDLVAGGPYGPNAQSPSAMVITTTPSAGTTETTGSTVNLYTD
jgi:eukaryotic-like serine/threonine-protein kinase